MCEDIGSCINADLIKSRALATVEGGGIGKTEWELFATDGEGEKWGFEIKIDAGNAVGGVGAISTVEELYFNVTWTCTNNDDMLVFH
jgi:hypothetical protein